MSTNPQGLTEEIETQEPVEQEEQTWDNNDSSSNETTDNSNEVPQKETVKENPVEKKYTSKKDYKDIAEKALKQAEWLRSVGDKRDAEYKKQMQEIAPLLELYKKAEQEKKSAELAKLSTENPAEYQKRLIDEAKAQLSQQYAPLQQQQQNQATEQEASTYINQMKQAYGEEVYSAAEPVMGQILEYTRQEKGPEIARTLAQNPEALMEMAIGRMYVAEYKKFQQNSQQSQQQGQKNQQRAVQFAKGTARPNAPAQRNIPTDGLSDADLKKAAYEEIVKRFKS